MYSFLEKKCPKLYKIIFRIDDFFERVSEHHVYLIGAGIAFNIFLYLIPLFLLAVYVVSLLFGQELMNNTLETAMTDLFPPTDTARNLISAILNEVYFITEHSNWAGWIGLGILLWLSSTLFNSLRTGLNAVYEIETPKIFIFYRLKDMFLAVILAVLILLSSYAVPIYSFIISILERALPSTFEPFISGFVLTGGSMLMSFVFFYLLFRFVPNKRVERYPRLISTAMSVILIEVSRNLFAWYLTSLSNYGRFYGTYAALVSMALWVYYFTLIILISAEAGYYINELRKAGKEKKSKAEQTKTEETQLSNSDNP